MLVPVLALTIGLLNPLYGHNSGKEFPEVPHLSTLADFVSAETGLSFKYLTVYFSSDTTNTSSYKAFQTILTREEIQAASVSRLHELFLLMDHWNGYTINGQDWNTEANGSFILNNTNWSVTIDGHPIQQTLPGWVSFNHLPVSLNQIEKVIITEAPGIYRGTFTRGGAIHILTRKNPNGDSQDLGWDARVRMMTANEINDPGPYAYTPLNSPNEERLGPDIDLSTSYTTDRGYLQASGSVMRHRTTDTPIEQRVKQMLFLGDRQFASPTSKKHAFHLAGGHQIGSGDLSIRTGGTHHSEIAFLRPYGRDLPIQFRHTYAGIQWAQPLTETLRFQGSGTWNRVDPGQRANREGAGFNFSRNNRILRGALLFSGKDRQVETGGQVEWINTETWNRSWQFSQRQTSVYGRWIESAGPLTVTAEAHLAVAEGETAPSFTLRTDWHPTSQHQVTAWFSHSLAPDWISPDYWFWRDNGYPGISGLDSPVAAFPERKPATLSSAGTEWNLTPSGSFQLTTRGSIWRQSNLFLARRQFQIVRPEQWFSHSGTTFHTDQESTRGQISLRLRFTSLPGLTHTLFGSLSRVFSATDERRRALQETEARTATLRTNWEPVAGFRIWSHLRFQAERTWHEFDSVNGELYQDQQQLTTNHYHNQTGPLTQLDAGGSKRFWNDRLTLDLILRNILNQPYQLHPVGVNHELTFFIQMEVQL
ncbi:MAG: hypothetical protein WD315_00395 [Balneolaceae bacterium]